MKRRFSSYDGFTLIELLTVILVIGILSTLILTASLTMKKQGRKRRAETEALTLENAIKAYRIEYGRWPVPAEFYTDDSTNSSTIWFRAGGNEDDPGGSGYCDGNGAVFKFLDPNEDGADYNPKRILFVETETFSLDGDVGSYPDVLTPWGAIGWYRDEQEYKNYYKISIDLNYPASGGSGVDVSYTSPE